MPIDDRLRAADLALYAAKQSGRARLEWARPDKRDAVVRPHDRFQVQMS